MSDRLQCSRCGSVSGQGICWAYINGYPEPSGEDHDMRPYREPAPLVVSLDDAMRELADPKALED